MTDFDAALARGEVPSDFRAKLERLREAGLVHHIIEQSSQLLVALLLAVNDGSFRGVTPAERERLLRVLAYVRKDDDQIPDYHTGGYADDQREIRAVLRELGPAIEAFKCWRLRHQVAALWSIGAGSSATDAASVARAPVSTHV